MSAFSAIARARFKVLLQYRAAAFAGLITQLCFGLILVSVMRAFYGSTTSAQPLALKDVVTYMWLGQAFFAIAPWRSDPEVKGMIRSGGVAYELLRPLDLYTLWYARALALKTAPIMLRAPPLIAIAVFLGLAAPASSEAFALWAVAMIGAIALSAAFTVLLNTSLLFTLSSDGVHFIAPMLVTLLSGQLVPLPLFPSWALPIVQALPFRGLTDTPQRIWVGDLSGAEALAAIAHQWIWVLALAIYGRWLLGRALKRVVIQGG